MKRSFLAFGSAAAIAIIFCCLLASAAGEKGNINLKITGFRNAMGAVRVAMFDSKESYDSDKFSGEGAFRKSIIDLKGTEAECKFEDVPYGVYAIKLFHDEDKSGKFYTGLFGIPKVEYAFSNNAAGRFGPASYEQAKFTLNSKELSMSIKMQSK